jgi:hypothetical protein
MHLMTGHASKEIRGRLIELIDQLHMSVWTEAFKAGGEAMREAIVRAAQAPDPLTAEPPTRELPSPMPEPEPGAQAPRESVGRIEEYRSGLRRLRLPSTSAPSTGPVLAAPSEVGFALQRQVIAEIARQKAEQKHEG